MFTFSREQAAKRFGNICGLNVSKLKTTSWTNLGNSSKSWRPRLAVRDILCARTGAFIYRYALSSKGTKAA